MIYVVPTSSKNPGAFVAGLLGLEGVKSKLKATSLEVTSISIE